MCFSINLQKKEKGKKNLYIQILIQHQSETDSAGSIQEWRKDDLLLKYEDIGEMF